MKRTLSNQTKDLLINSSLWKNKLKDDCQKQKVFLAIRDNYIDFYHKGGRLFNFNKKGIRTHIKYASVIESNGQDYLTQDELKKSNLSTDFETGYNRIRENCARFSTTESLCVSEIYHRHSYLSTSNVVVLDIEICFESLNMKGKMDRIDFLIYDKNTKILQFIEAKHFTNPEIWSATRPRVIDQIDRYEKQIDYRKQSILENYVEYVKILNDLFGISLPVPVEIHPKTILMIFGFDDNQKRGRLRELITENTEFTDKKVYTIGKIAGYKPKIIF